MEVLAAGVHLLLKLRACSAVVLRSLTSKMTAVVKPPEGKNCWRRCVRRSRELGGIGEFAFVAGIRHQLCTIEY